MKLSVIIPTYQRAPLLIQCLESLKAQDLEPASFEVVIVDDGSADGTAQVLTELPSNFTPIIQSRNSGPAAARNRGLASARAGLVLFLDDDIVAAPELLSTHLALHGEAADPLLGVLGRVDWHPDLKVTAFMRWVDRSGLQFAYDTWLREGPVEPPYAAFYTANVSLRRDLLERVGGFDERFPYPAFEDMELAFRLARHGFHMDYRPRARAFHARSMTLASFAARMEKVGESAELMRRAAPEFPLDDEQLRNAYVGRLGRLRRRAAAMGGDEAVRWSYYWAVIGAAYGRGRWRAATR